jgi:hypothetical protein
MGELQELWDEVEHAVAESLGNSEGRASAWHLEHNFRKAELGVYRQPDHPLDKPTPAVAWKIVWEWLRDKNQQEVRDDVVLDGVMTASEMRAVCKLFFPKKNS